MKAETLAQLIAEEPDTIQAILRACARRGPDMIEKVRKAARIDCQKRATWSVLCAPRA